MYMYIYKHISEIRDPVSSCKLPQHVYQCRTGKKYITEPFFKIYSTLSCNNDSKSETIETSFHKKYYDTLNRCSN